MLWNGQTLWRGTVWAPPFLTGRSMVVVGHFGKRVAYPLSEPRADGLVLTNVVFEAQTAAGRPMPRQDWDHTADPDDARTRFETFRFDWLDLAALIGAAPVWWQYPMADRDPLPQWSFGRVTLMGDAAHPMYPVGSNGASQAIIDARTLARSLALEPTPEAAFAARGRAPPGDRRHRAVQPQGAVRVVHGAGRGAGPGRLRRRERRLRAGRARSHRHRVQTPGRLRSRDPERTPVAQRRTAVVARARPVGFARRIVAASTTDSRQNEPKESHRRRRSAQRPSLTVQPPSTAMIWPVICALASPQSQAGAGDVAGLQEPRASGCLRSA